MSTFIIEHIYKGYPIVERITGVEDIDINQFANLKTLWVCETEEEIIAVEKELRRKHERSSESP